MKTLRALLTGHGVAGLAWGCYSLGASTASDALHLVSVGALLPGMFVSTVFQLLLLGRGGHGDGYYGPEQVLLNGLFYGAVILIWQNRRRSPSSSATRRNKA